MRAGHAGGALRRRDADREDRAISRREFQVALRNEPRAATVTVKSETAALLCIDRGSSSDFLFFVSLTIIFRQAKAISGSSDEGS